MGKLRSNLRLQLSITVLVVALLIAGHGDSTGPGWGGVLVSCTSGERDAFPEVLLDGEPMPGDELADLPEGAALVAFFAPTTGGYPERLFLDVDGYLVLGDGVIGGMKDGQLVSDFHLVRDGSHWSVQSWGGCRPRKVNGELVAEPWVLSQQPAASSRTLTIGVWGGECVGTDAKTEISFIEVVETDGMVTITTWATAPQRRMDECAGIAINIPATVGLADQLGDRHLLDGGAVPPVDPAENH